MITHMPSQDDHVDAGRDLVQYSWLVVLRQRLGFTRSAMAEMLHMSPVTYNRCEDEPDSAGRMWKSTAERLGRFAWLAEKTLNELSNENVELSDLTPLHVVATTYGLPQEVMLQWYRRGIIRADDLGILGLWIHKDDEHFLREVA